MNHKETEKRTEAPQQVPLTPGQALNLACHDLLPPKTPQQRYLILAQPRTGSNYICRRLCNIIGRFGLPSEYLNPNHIPLLLPRIVQPSKGSTEIKTDLVTYLTGLEKIRTTDDGMFGIKVQPAQLFQHTGRDLDRITSLISRFDRIILMTRRDKLGQAISRTIAEATNIWFNDGSEVQISAAEQRRLVPAIARNLATCIEDESALLAIRRRVVRPLIRIAYEDIEDTPHEVIQEITAFLSGGFADTLNEGNAFQIPKKSTGTTVGELRRLFLASVQGHRP